jgi:hypothetical protein
MANMNNGVGYRMPFIVIDLVSCLAIRIFHASASLTQSRKAGWFGFLMTKAAQQIVTTGNMA